MRYLPSLVFPTAQNYTARSVLILWCIVVGGCSNKQIYENIQLNAQQECRKLPTSSYQERLDRHSQSFESYTKSREGALKNQITP